MSPFEESVARLGAPKSRHTCSIHANDHYKRKIATQHAKALGHFMVIRKVTYIRSEGERLRSLDPGTTEANLHASLVSPA
jgi:hypothetical protein